MWERIKLEHHSYRYSRDHDKEKLDFFLNNFFEDSKLKLESVC